MTQEKTKNYMGGKAASILKLREKGFLVPQTAVLDIKWFLKFLEVNHLEHDINDLCQYINKENFCRISDKLKKKITDGNLDDASYEFIERKLNEINGNLLAIRSSSIYEDSGQNSFAGMYDSYLNVPKRTEDVIPLIKNCWASIFNDRAIAYKLHKGIPIFDRMAVILQEMIAAQYSGVVNTVHPVFRDTILLEITEGLGHNLVEGRVIPYQYLIDKRDLSIRDKGGQETLVDRKVIIDISKTCLQIEQIFHSPQDIEFCISDEGVYYLQTRPLSYR